MICPADGWWAIFRDPRDGTFFAAEVVVWKEADDIVSGLIVAEDGSSCLEDAAEDENFYRYFYGDFEAVRSRVDGLDAEFAGKEEPNMNESETKPTEDEESNEAPEAPADETPDEPKEEEPAEA